MNMENTFERLRSSRDSPFFTARGLISKYMYLQSSSDVKSKDINICIYLERAYLHGKLKVNFVLALNQVHATKPLLNKIP